MLEDIVDHTNVGAIFRSAAGIGADAVLVSPAAPTRSTAASVRVSMGTVFQVPVGPLRDLAGRARGVARRTVSPSPPWPCATTRSTLGELAARPPDKLALVLGTEGDGLGPRTLAAADLTVRIPMAGGVDSLNVAAAAAVALWALQPTSAPEGAGSEQD